MNPSEIYIVIAYGLLASWEKNKKKQERAIAANTASEIFIAILLVATL